jgi:hypothetical protein
MEVNILEGFVTPMAENTLGMGFVSTMADDKWEVVFVSFRVVNRLEGFESRMSDNSLEVFSLPKPVTSLPICLFGSSLCVFGDVVGVTLGTSMLSAAFLVSPSPFVVVFNSGKKLSLVTFFFFS